MSTHIPPLRFHALTRFYDRIVALTSAEARFRPALLELLPSRPGALIVEVGCGTGTLTWLLAQRFPDAKVVGVDRDERALRFARAKAGTSPLAPAFEAADGRALPFGNDSVDAVVTSLFFHHLLPDAKMRVLEETRRVLRPGGQFVVADCGRPHSLLAAAGFLSVRLLDGFAVTRDHMDETFPARLRAAGFRDATENAWFGAAVGTIRLWQATKTSEFSPDR